MTKVVIGKLPKHPPKRRPPGVTVRWARDATGRRVRLLVLDINSPTFGDDFYYVFAYYVFARNVARARRENKRITGSYDVVPPNG